MKIQPAHIRQHGQGGGIGLDKRGTAAAEHFKKGVIINSAVFIGKQQFWSHAHTRFQIDTPAKRAMLIFNRQALLKKQTLSDQPSCNFMTASTNAPVLLYTSCMPEASI